MPHDLTSPWKTCGARLRLRRETHGSVQQGRKTRILGMAQVHVIRHARIRLIAHKVAR